MFLSSGTATLATASLLVTHMPRFLGQTLGLLQRWLSLRASACVHMPLHWLVCLSGLAHMLEEAFDSGVF